MEEISVTNREYLILSDTSPDALEEKVSRFLNKHSAECQGGIYVLLDSGTRVYMQAIVCPKN